MSALIDWIGGTTAGLIKPPGLPVFPPHADMDGDCVLARGLEVRPALAEIDWPAGFAGGIAHRLDVPTSGRVLAALDLDALETMRGWFRDGCLSKHYRFISRGSVPWDTHHVTVRIAHDKRRRARMVVERGRATPHRGRWYAADTRFARIADIPGWGSLWSAVMSTGVTHQIRVHAAFVGIALMGDRLYGGAPAPSPLPVPFLLHHHRIEGVDLPATSVSLPEFWPVG